MTFISLYNDKCTEIQVFKSISDKEAHYFSNVFTSFFIGFTVLR